MDKSKGGAVVVTEIVSTVQSLRQARRALDEMAIGWKAGVPGKWGAVYERGKHRLYIEKKAERQWQVVKSTAEEAVA